MGECYVEWFAIGLECRKGGRRELAHPNLFVVQVRENRFQEIARNITHIMRYFGNDILPLGMSFFDILPSFILFLILTLFTALRMSRGTEQRVRGAGNPRLVLRG